MTPEQMMSVQPMTKRLAEPFYLQGFAWEPSAIERLAALEDPEMAKRVADFDSLVSRLIRLSNEVYKRTKRQAAKQ